MAHAREDLARLVIVLPPEEHEAFLRWCMFPAGGGKRLSMTAAARELIRAATEGKIVIDRQRAAKLSRTAPPKKLSSPPPAPEKKKGKGK